MIFFNYHLKAMYFNRKAVETPKINSKYKFHEYVDFFYKDDLYLDTFQRFILMIIIMYFAILILRDNALQHSLKKTKKKW